MALINHEAREVVFKIVYCGTPVSGKTTNLAYVHHRIDKSQRGDLVSLATSADRTLFFDFLPVHAAAINGFKTRFQLYTVPGQVHYNATRQLVLRGVDGLVFVADSHRDRLDENVASLRTMIDNVRRNHADPSLIPTVLQYNKRDLPDAIPSRELDARLNQAALLGRRVPAFEAIASEGRNVLATLNAVSQEILRRFHRIAHGRGGAPAPAPNRQMRPEAGADSPVLAS